MAHYEALEHCTLCPRKCGINRYEKTGFCSMGALPVVNLYMLHHGEEPPISGRLGTEDTRGSGTVFFEGCSAKCIFCQNSKISGGPTGKGEGADSSRLAEIYLELQDKGAYNINLVTPMHFAPVIADSIKRAKDNGLKIPVAVNTGGYDEVDTLKMLDGLVDIYMPDFKVWDPKTARQILHAPDYADKAASAIREMFRQVGPADIDPDTDLMRKGMIVRHLMLPGKLFDTKKILDFLTGEFGNDIYISLMSQYTPMPTLPTDAPDFLRRTVPSGHYDSASDYLIDKGQINAFVQDSSSQGDLLIPDFKD
ncbi:putative pyruvate formate lyase activating enzyme [Oscillospiraceae bacterium]|nr:putative pyruvate formate lyase activating enzyme [Oscillospiraceae bacterium]